LQNIAKYAEAGGATVRLGEANGDLTFVVEDDGVGFEPATATGSGLRNMRDRLEALRGDLQIISAHGAGTSITGRVPAPALESMTS
jgi:signal transduction histidine kinase